MIRPQDKTVVKEFAHTMSAKSKYLLLEIETAAKTKIGESPSPFPDKGKIMTGESRLAGHDTRIMAGES